AGPGLRPGGGDHHLQPGAQPEGIPHRAHLRLRGGGRGTRFVVSEAAARGAMKPGLETAPGIVVRAGLSSEDARRDAYVRAHPRGTFFHLAGWRRVVERVHGHDALELFAWRGKDMVGVLPLMLCRGFFGGARGLISMPYATYGGPLADDHEIERALVAHARHMAEELSAGYLELRCIEDPKLELVPNPLYCTFIRELPDDPAQILARMPK